MCFKMNQKRLIHRQFSESVIKSFMINLLEFKIHYLKDYSLFIPLRIIYKKNAF